MLDPKKRGRLKPADARFLAIIDEYGWHVMSVAPRTKSDDREEWFSYSTGLFLSFSCPEIVVCGLGDDAGRGIINEIGTAMKGGRRFELEKDYNDIFANSVRCRFRPVQASRYQHYVSWSQWFYESNDFPVWQCFWPDRNGNYPWDPVCNREVSALQPLLYLPAQPVM